MKRYVFIISLLFLYTALYASGAGEFNRDLFFGLKNDADVVRLQDFLRSQKLFSEKESTGNYLQLTQSAVAKFQLKNDILPAAGYFGPLSRKKANELLSPEDSLPESTTGPLFNHNLYAGSQNDPDIPRLQNILRTFGYFTYATSTHIYGPFTKEAVVRYQIKEGIVPADGQFTILTRLFINQNIISGIIETDKESTRTTPAGRTATSTFYKKITISSFSGKNSVPIRETLTITNRTKNETIDITAWTVTTSNGMVITIPKVYNLPGIPNAALGNLLLPPGGKVTITVGKQAKNMDFRENICTGYFAEQASFQPSLSRRCPRVSTKELTYLDDRCLTTLNRISACKMPKQSDYFAQSSACSDYMVKNLSYAGCVRNHQTEPKFFINNWLIWLQRDQPIFRNIRETITLRDRKDRFVDKRGY